MHFISQPTSENEINMQQKCTISNNDSETMIQYFLTTNLLLLLLPTTKKKAVNKKEEEKCRTNEEKKMHKFQTHIYVLTRLIFRDIYKNTKGEKCLAN